MKVFSRNDTGRTNVKQTTPLQTEKDHSPVLSMTNVQQKRVPIPYSLPPTGVSPLSKYNNEGVFQK